MKRSDKERLLDPLNVDVEQLGLRGNRLLLRTGRPEATGDSFARTSWDRYFTDLSFGSYTPLVSDGRRVARARVWHYLFKNLAIVERILQHPRSPLTVLDVGCASGYFRRFLEGNLPAGDDKRVYYWGLDIRRSPLERATYATQDIEAGAAGNRTPSAFIQHDVGRSLPFKDNSLDFILNLEMLKYLPLPQGERLLAETVRVLRPDGLFVLSMPTSFEYYRQLKPGYMIALDPNQLVARLQAAGLAVERIFGSQTRFQYLADGVDERHRETFQALLAYHPPEIVAAFFAPLYPAYSTGLTYLCRCQT